MKICKKWHFTVVIVTLVVCNLQGNEIVQGGERQSFESNPAKREQHEIDYSLNFDEKESEQWPLYPWRESLPGELKNPERKRRSSHDLVPVDLDLFRREFIGPKPQWRPPTQKVNDKRLEMKTLNELN